MKLSVRDRILLMSVLPKEDSYTNLVQIRSLNQKLGFTDDEQGLYKFNRKDDAILWDENADQDKDIDISEVENTVIQTSLRNMSRSNKLNIEMLDLYEMFIEPTRE